MFVFVLLIINKIVSNCSDWPKGLNNTYIENNESLYGCQIQFPKLAIIHTHIHIYISRRYIKIIDVIIKRSSRLF